MTQPQDYLYYKGYVAGYRDCLAEAASGNVEKSAEIDIVSLPVKAMALPTRAYNCLIRAGCIHIADVVALSEYTIATMRHLGTKSASEIAHWLDAHGLCYSAWNKYL